ncbi:MAG TPA: hypothetical protein VKN76_13375 [Kiloniellaceae bacterium]|nr:hypothetical protein [Kiloniellaceae bacterium]
MANVTYSSGAPWQGGVFRAAMKRGRFAITMQLESLRWELAEQRRHYRVERGLRDLDLYQLRDIGIDRNSC